MGFFLRSWRLPPPSVIHYKFFSLIHFFSRRAFAYLLIVAPPDEMGPEVAARLLWDFLRTNAPPDALIVGDVLGFAARNFRASPPASRDASGAGRLQLPDLEGAAAHLKFCPDTVIPPSVCQPFELFVETRRAALCLPGKSAKIRLTPPGRMRRW